VNLTKKNISKNISIKLGLSNDDSIKLLNKFNEFISKKSKLGYQVKISKFGVFALKETKKRIGRNPLTKKEYIIKSMDKVAFKPSNVIKKKLN
tara:strand:+ start:3008 stop:3286 length:279 start_codon:yes stop_codon:yes gene_type:complete